MHLFHPGVVHFAVAFLVLGGIVEAWGLLTRAERATRFGEKLVMLGAVSMLPAMVTGYLAANTVAMAPAATAVLAAHERNAWILLGLFLVALVWKGWFRGELPAAQRPFYALLLLAAIVLTVWSAILGGEMVYTHGVGVNG